MRNHLAKRTLAILFLCILMAAMPVANALEADANTFPIATEETHLTALFLNVRPEIVDWATNGVTKYWEEKTGITVDIEAVPYASTPTTLAVYMDSNELPDIIIGGIDAGAMVVYGSQGLLMPLNDLIDRYGVNTQALFEADPMVKACITAPDGNIYTLPAYTSQIGQHGLHSYKMLFNYQWLENLNLEVPTTLDELYNVLCAFRDEDANGNGDPDDEIPLSAVNGRLGSQIMNCFVHTDLNNKYFYVEDGTIKTSYTQEGWKEGLKYLAMLYRENLLDKESFVNNTNSLKLLTGAETGNRIGAAEVNAFSNIMDTTTEVHNEFGFIEPIATVDGRKVAPTAVANIIPTFFITKSCKDPEAAFRWADAQMVDPLADNLAGLEGVYGPEGSSWRRAVEGETGLDGKTPATYAWTFTWGSPNNDHYHEYGLLTRMGNYKLYMVSDDTGAWNQEPVLYNAMINLYHPYALPVENTFPTSCIMFTEEDAVEAVQLLSDIIVYVNDSFAKFVTGVADVDADWDNYINELYETYQYEKLMEYYQTAYDIQFAAN